MWEWQYTWGLPSTNFGQALIGMRYYIISKYSLEHYHVLILHYLLHIGLYFGYELCSVPLKRIIVLFVILYNLYPMCCDALFFPFFRGEGCNLDVPYKIKH